jgi:VanZ family protein
MGIVLSTRQRNLVRTLWVILVLLVIVGSVLPASSLPLRAIDKLHLNDKILHFFTYAVLALLPALHESRRAITLFLVAVILLGVLLEFAQSFAAGRLFELGDMIANAWGAFCGFTLGALARL